MEVIFKNTGKNNWRKSKIDTQMPRNRMKKYWHSHNCFRYGRLLTSVLRHLSYLPCDDIGSLCRDRIWFSLPPPYVSLDFALGFVNCFDGIDVIRVMLTGDLYCSCGSMCPFVPLLSPEISSGSLLLLRSGRN